MYIDPASNIGLCVLSNGGGTNLYICDALYDYALSLNPINGIVPECGFVNVSEHLPENKKIIKVLDLLGRETTIKPNTTLIYMYSDGTSERRMIIE